MEQLQGYLETGAARYPVRWARDGRVAYLSRSAALIYSPILKNSASPSCRREELTWKAFANSALADNAARARGGSGIQSGFTHCSWSHMGMSWDGGCALALLGNLGYKFQRGEVASPCPVLAIYLPCRNSHEYTWSQELSISQMAEEKRLPSAHQQFTCAEWLPRAVRCGAWLAVGSKNSLYLYVWPIMVGRKGGPQTFEFSRLQIHPDGPLAIELPEGADREGGVEHMAWYTSSESNHLLVVALEYGAIYVCKLQDKDGRPHISSDIGAVRCIRERNGEHPGSLVAAAYPPTRDSTFNEDSESPSSVVIAVGESSGMTLLLYDDYLLPPDNDAAAAEPLAVSTTFSCQRHITHIEVQTDYWESAMGRPRLFFYTCSGGCEVMKWDIDCSNLRVRSTTPVYSGVQSIAGFSFSPSGAIISLVTIEHPLTRELSVTQKVRILRLPHSRIILVLLRHAAGKTIQDFDRQHIWRSASTSPICLSDYLWYLELDSVHLDNWVDIANDALREETLRNASDLSLRLNHMMVSVCQAMYVRDQREAQALSFARRLRHELVRRARARTSAPAALERENRGVQPADQSCECGQAVVEVFPLKAKCASHHSTRLCMRSNNLCKGYGATCPLCKEKLSREMVAGHIFERCTFCESLLQDESGE